jgi:hypothetical protein
MSISPDLITGDSKDGKTTLLGTAAKWIYKKYGLKSRLYHADPGGYDTLLPLINLGVLDVFDVTGMQVKYALDFLRKCCQGYWPSADGKFLAPSEQSKINEVGGWFYEGLMAFGDMLLAYFGERTARGVPGVDIGKAIDAPFWLTEGEGKDAYKIGGNSMTHYNMAQTEIHAMVKMTRRLPTAKKVVWTSTEMRGTDRETGELLYGPVLAGKAKVAKVPSWFGNYLSLEVIKEGGKLKHILHTKQWIENVGGVMVPHHNGSRICVANAQPVELPLPTVIAPDLGIVYDAMEAELQKVTAACAKELNIGQGKE